MKFTAVFVALGLIISVGWIAWGFFPMLAILLTTIIFGTIGYLLDIMGYSLKAFTSKVLSKITE